MLAHGQGTLLNAARLAAGLGVSGQTVARYTDLLTDLLLVRRLPPLHANVGKRLVRSPRVPLQEGVEAIGLRALAGALAAVAAGR